MVPVTNKMQFVSHRIIIKEKSYTKKYTTEMFMFI